MRNALLPDTRSAWASRSRPVGTGTQEAGADARYARLGISTDCISPRAPLGVTALRRGEARPTFRGRTDRPTSRGADVRMEALRSRRIQEALSRKRGEIRRVPPTSSQPTTAIQACLQAAAAAEDSVSGRSGRFSMPGLLATRMEALLGDERFADIVVAIGGRTFPCHRAVLAAVCHTGLEPRTGRPSAGLLLTRLSLPVDSGRASSTPCSAVSGQRPLRGR